MSKKSAYPPRRRGDREVRRVLDGILDSVNSLSPQRARQLIEALAEAYTR